MIRWPGQVKGKKGRHKYCNLGAQEPTPIGNGLASICGKDYLPICCANKNQLNSVYLLTVLGPSPLNPHKDCADKTEFLRK